MNHEQARLQIGAQPGASSAALAAHLAGCASCSVFRRQMLRLEEDLRRVLSAPPGPAQDANAAFRAQPAVPRPLLTQHGGAARLTMPSRPTPSGTARPAPGRVPRGWLAAAASLLLAAALSLTFWSLRPAPSLASDLIQHVEAESASWSQVRPMTAAAAGPVLQAAGVSLDGSAASVVYARICLLHGHWVPHLVVRTDRGPVTVLILRSEPVPARRSFRENGYAGVLIPEPAGATLAVLTRNGSDIDAAVRRVNQYIHWLH